MSEIFEVDLEQDKEPVKETSSRAAARQREIRRKLDDAIEAKRLREELGYDLD